MRQRKDQTAFYLVLGLKSEALARKYCFFASISPFTTQMLLASMRVGRVLMRVQTLLTAAIAAATLVLPVAAKATIRLANDPGGLIAAYDQRFLRARASGERIVIDGSCLSTCTFAIGYVPREQICATPRAVLGFHAAWQPTPFGKQVSFPATKHMMDVYPEDVRGWIGRHGGLTPHMIFLRGSELAAMVPACGEADMAAVARAPERPMGVRPPGRRIIAFRPIRRPIFAVRRMY
jgi:hypothetical protein